MEYIVYGQGTTNTPWTNNSHDQLSWEDNNRSQIILKWFFKGLYFRVVKVLSDPDKPVNRSSFSNSIYNTDWKLSYCCCFFRQPYSLFICILYTIVYLPILIENIVLILYRVIHMILCWWTFMHLYDNLHVKMLQSPTCNCIWDKMHAWSTLFICNVCGHSVIAQLDVSDYVSWMKCITQIGALDTNVCD